MPEKARELVWDVYRCPLCGGDAPMGVMSLVAYCVDCGARNIDYNPMRTWVMPWAQGAD